MESVINVENFYFAYKKSDLVLRDINFEIKKGSFTVITGPSGAGKTTLCKAMTGIVPYYMGGRYSGDVKINGESTKGKRVSDIAMRVGFIMEDYESQLVSLTAGEEIAFSLLNHGFAPHEVEERTRQALEDVGLPGRESYQLDELSGGQRQRLGIARALALEPKIIVCDEATSALDPQTTKSILHLLQDINKKMNLTIVLITHQMEVVKTICDRVAVIESGDIIEEGPMIDVFTNPQHPTTKEFTKSVINAELPDIVKQMKLSDTYTEGSKLLVRISFIGDSASEPIISGMVKHFDVDVSIISGNTDQLKDVLFGTLLIEISGNRERIKNALEYLHQQHLKTEVIGYES